MSKVFLKSLMASEDVKAYIGTGVFYSGTTKTAIDDGAAVVVGALEDSDAYAGLKDINTRKLTAPAAVTAKVALVDYVGVSSGDIAGVNYREGIKTAGLQAPAGATVRYRIPQVGDTFWLGSDNFGSGTPVAGKYGILTANATTFAVADAATANFCFAIETTKNLVEGAVNTDTLYFCRVVAC